MKCMIQNYCVVFELRTVSIVLLWSSPGLFTFIYCIILRPARTTHATQGFFHKFQLKIYFLFVIDT